MEIAEALLRLGREELEGEVGAAGGQGGDLVGELIHGPGCGRGDWRFGCG